jgi:hypothetical protein
MKTATELFAYQLERWHARKLACEQVAARNTIAHLEGLARECERAGLIGAALDNERQIAALRSRYGV